MELNLDEYIEHQQNKINEIEVNIARKLDAKLNYRMNQLQQLDKETWEKSVIKNGTKRTRSVQLTGICSKSAKISKPLKVYSIKSDSCFSGKCDGEAVDLTIDDDHIDEIGGPDNKMYKVPESFVDVDTGIVIIDDNELRSEKKDEVVRNMNTSKSQV